MKKLVYYPSAGICFFGAFILGRVVVTEEVPLSMQQRAMWGGVSAALAVAGTSCLRVAHLKKTTKKDSSE